MSQKNRSFFDTKTLMTPLRIALSLDKFAYLRGLLIAVVCTLIVNTLNQGEFMKSFLLTALFFLFGIQFSYAASCDVNMVDSDNKIITFYEGEGEDQNLACENAMNKCLPLEGVLNGTCEEPIVDEQMQSTPIIQEQVDADKHPRFRRHRHRGGRTIFGRRYVRRCRAHLISRNGFRISTFRARGVGLTRRMALRRACRKALRQCRRSRRFIGQRGSRCVLRRRLVLL